jgi:threonine dehydrogenase-like Zn-dependent dehydrogenase
MNPLVLSRKVRKYKMYHVKCIVNIVQIVGAKVKNLKVGDRVALEPGAACRICDQCKAGKYQVCYRSIFSTCRAIDCVFF